MLCEFFFFEISGGGAFVGNMFGCAYRLMRLGCGG